MPSTPSDRRRPSSLMLRSYSLETEVERLLRAGEYELAVLLSQTLLELRVEADLWEHFEAIHEPRLGEAALGLLPSYNIGNGRVQAFFECLVGEKLRAADQDVMGALREHVERRNGVAHRGERVSGPEARASLSAVVAASRLVHELSYRSLGLEDVLEDEARQVRDEDWA